MPLNLYRRHRLECEGGHPEESRSGEFEERSKKWKRCSCQIFASGTLAGKFKRRHTGRSDWESAKAVALAWETAGQWDSPAPSPPAVAAPIPETASSVTLARAIGAFLDEHRQNSARNTVRKYYQILKRLTTYAEHKGYLYLNQWGPIDVRECRAAWGVSTATANRDMSVVRAFFDFCVINEWLDRNPAKLVKNFRSRAGSEGRSEQKLPFSDAELKRMYDCAEHRYGKMYIQWDREIHHKVAEGQFANYKYSWTGKDLADFITLSVYTGLRISDVSTFHVDRLNARGEIRIRTTKAGTHVFTWVPEWIQEMIRRRSLEVGPLIFGKHATDDMNVVADIWRRKLKRLWRLCETDGFRWSDKPHPHRFRHTFARILLSRPDVTVRDVAELLGDTEEMIRKHYSAWIPERQRRLTDVLRKAFQETPRPKNVVEMPRTGTEE